MVKIEPDNQDNGQNLSLLSACAGVKKEQRLH